MSRPSVLKKALEAARRDLTTQGTKALAKVVPVRAAFFAQYAPSPAKMARINGFAGKIAVQGDKSLRCQYFG